MTVVLVTCITACADDATRLQRAKEQLAESNYRAATIDLKNILQGNPEHTEARVLLGEIALRNGDTAGAIKEFRRAREAGASPDIYAVNLARALLREGRHQEVISLNPELLTDEQNRAALLAMRGTARLAQEDTAAAQQDFSAALALVPDQTDALIGQARLAQASGDAAAARASLEKMVATGANNHEGMAALAQLNFDEGNYEQAEQNLRTALQAIEGTRLAHERMMYTGALIDVLLAQRKATEAQAVGSNMIKMTSEHPIALLQAGRADMAAKNYDGAIEKAERIVLSLPRAIPPRILLAGAAMAQGNRTLAATHLQAVVNINPDNEAARKLLAQVRMQMGDPEEALAVLEPMMAGGTTDPQILAMAGSASIRSGDVASGIELVEKGMVSSSGNPAFALQAAVDFLSAGELDRAIGVLESIPESEQFGQRELLLVLALTRKGEVEKARAMAQEIVDANPDRSTSHRLMGGFHLAVNEFDQARAAFERALEIDPDDVPAILNLGRLDVNQGNPEAAEARFRSLLERKPGDLVALTVLAELAEKRGDLAAGVELLEQARVANPEAIQPLLVLGNYYHRAGDKEKAVELAEQAVRVAPDNARSHVLLGTVLLKDKQNEQAIVALQRGIEINPDYGMAHFFLGQAQIATGRAEAGYASLQRAAELETNDFRPLAALVAADTKRGDYRKALANADLMIEQHPGRAEPFLLKADVEVSRKDLPAALELLENAVAIKPSRDLASKRFTIMHQLGRPEPWRVLADWVDANPDDAAGRELLAKAYLSAGMTDKAIDNFEQVMVDMPNADVAATLAMAYAEEKNLDAAAKWLEEGISLEPDNMPIRVALARLELNRGNENAAATLMRELRKDFPDAAEPYVIEGEVLMAQGDYNGAIAAYDKAADISPSASAALRQYQAQRKAGRDEAYRSLEEWAEKEPGNMRVSLALGMDYSARDWNDEAVAAYRRVLEADPDNLIALNNLAWVYDARGGDQDAERALNAATRAYKQRPGVAAIADTYGWFLLRAGRGAEALEVLEKAAASGSDPEINYHLAAALDDQGRTADAVALLDRVLADNAEFSSRAEAEVLRRRLSP
ncbi:MAG: PEP-CTERM system TPR-repeat protein PrsT [Gammaproteobacteria bacterium]|nr:PEP-CTERM system TPR-repeat protein PrsT [Gammaproteobacteria bacterium]